MSLADRLAVPAEWQARQKTVDGVTEYVSEPVRTDARTQTPEDRALLGQFGYDPDVHEIVGTVNQWQKQTPDGTWLTSYFFKVRPRETNIDLPALYATSKRKPKTPLRVTADSRITVVALADVQAGKTGSRGGTPELIERLAQKRERLAAHLKTRKPQSTVLAEVGDLFENFESGGNPAFTNDLSLAQQMDLTATELYKFIDVMQRHGHVDVVAVPSNHTSWRRAGLLHG